jgi:hypothetical protein
MFIGALADRVAHRRIIAALYALRNKSTHGSEREGSDLPKNEAAVAKASALYGKLLDGFGVSANVSTGSRSN